MVPIDPDFLKNSLIVKFYSVLERYGLKLQAQGTNFTLQEGDSDISRLDLR